MNLPEGSQGVLPALNDKGEDRSLGYQITRKGLLRGQPVAVLQVWFEHKPHEEAEVFLALDVPGLIIQAKAFDENGIQHGVLRLRDWKLL